MFAQFKSQSVCDPDADAAELSPSRALRRESAVDRAIETRDRSGIAERSAGGDAR